MSFDRLSEYSGTENDLLKKYLLQLENEKIIMKISDIKKVSCNQCDSLRVIPNFSALHVTVLTLFKEN